MAHYAFLDDNNTVTHVIVGVEEFELIEGKTPETWYGKFQNQRCVRTSYNGKIRKNYAGIGFSYDEALDAFIPPKPFDSWLLNKEAANWEPPVPMPEGNYRWDEDTLSWIAA
jgi:hypothetical protein